MEPPQKSIVMGTTQINKVFKNMKSLCPLEVRVAPAASLCGKSLI